MAGFLDSCLKTGSESRNCISDWRRKKGGDDDDEVGFRQSPNGGGKREETALLRHPTVNSRLTDSKCGAAHSSTVDMISVSPTM